MAATEALRTIARYMTPDPVTLTCSESTSLARNLLASRGFRMLPVVDVSGRLCGVVSASDLIASHEDGPLEGLMSKSVLTARVDDAVEDAARVMVAESVHHLVVVDDLHAPVGVLSVSDLVAVIKDLGPTIHAGHVMCRDVTTVWESTPLSECVGYLEPGGVSSLVVVSDDRRHVRGVVSQLAVLARRGKSTSETLIKELVDPRLLLMPEEATLAEVAHTMAAESALQVLIADEEAEILGIITPTDLARWLTEMPPKLEAAAAPR